MAEDRRLMRLAPLAPRPRELPVLVPDPRWWAAWERWAKVSDRLEASRFSRSAWDGDAR